MESAGPDLPDDRVVNLSAHDAADHRNHVTGFFLRLERHGGAVITDDDNPNTFQGSAPRQSRVIIIRDPSEGHARRCYADPDDQALAAHRRVGSTIEFPIMVHGLPTRA